MHADINIQGLRGLSQRERLPRLSDQSAGVLAGRQEQNRRHPIQDRTCKRRCSGSSLWKNCVSKQIKAV